MLSLMLPNYVNFVKIDGLGKLWQMKLILRKSICLVSAISLFAKHGHMIKSHDPTLVYKQPRSLSAESQGSLLLSPPNRPQVCAFSLNDCNGLLCQVLSSFYGHFMAEWFSSIVLSSRDKSLRLRMQASQNVLVDMIYSWRLITL